MKAVFWKCLIVFCISVRQSESYHNTDELNCSTRCMTGYTCSLVTMASGKRAPSCVPLHSVKAPILTRQHRRQNAFSRTSGSTWQRGKYPSPSFNRIDSAANKHMIVKNHLLHNDRFRTAVHHVLKNIVYRNLGSPGVVPGPINTALRDSRNSSPGETIPDSGDRFGVVPGPIKTVHRDLNPGPGKMVSYPGDQSMIKGIAIPVDTMIKRTSDRGASNNASIGGDGNSIGDVQGFPGEHVKAPGSGTGCKECTDNSECTGSGEYCYHAATCATLICQPL